MKSSIVSSFQPWRGLTAASWGALALALLTLSLGVWQWHRSLEKEAILSQALIRSTQMSALMPGSEPKFQDRPEAAEMNQRRVGLAGRWLPETTLYLDNRLHEGQAGIQVMTALSLADGSVAWVNRGWAPKQPGMAEPDRESLIQGRRFQPADATPILIEAVALTDLLRRLELGSRPEELRQGALWQNPDWPALTDRVAKTATVRGVWPLVFWQTSDSQDGLIRQLPQVQAKDVSKHQGYALQWWLMSLAALVFAWRLRDRSTAPSAQP